MYSGSLAQSQVLLTMQSERALLGARTTTNGFNGKQLQSAYCRQDAELQYEIVVSKCNWKDAVKTSVFF